MKRFFVIYTWIFVVLWGCKKTSSVVPETKPNEQQVTLRLLMPQQDTKMGTYAIGEMDQNAILTLDVLAFRIADGKEYYAYHKRGVLLAPNPGATEVNFHVDLLKSTDNYRFVLIANAAAQLQTALGGLQANAEKETLMARISYSISSKWNASSPSNFMPLPMWGESSIIPGVNTTTAGFGVSMLRSLAAIDISVGASDFVMTQVLVYNQSNKGLVAPVRENYDTGTHTVTAPSMPTGTVPLGTQRYASGAKALLNEIFLFESAAAANIGEASATALVIAGKYEGSNIETFYRIDLADEHGKPLPILRNHRYRIDITTVHGAGFSTEAQAWSSKPIGMTATVTPWNEVNIADTNIPPQYYLKVSITKAEVNGLRSELIFDLHTNAPNATLELPNWLSVLERNELGDKITYKLRINENPSTTALRSGKINVKVKQLTRVINIVQGGRPANLGPNYNFYVFAQDITDGGPSLNWYAFANVENGLISTLDASLTQKSGEPYPKSCVARLGPGARLPTYAELERLMPDGNKQRDVVNAALIAAGAAPIPYTQGTSIPYYISSSAAGHPAQFRIIRFDGEKFFYAKSTAFGNYTARCVISK